MALLRRDPLVKKEERSQYGPWRREYSAMAKKVGANAARTRMLHSYREPPPVALLQERGDAGAEVGRPGRRALLLIGGIAYAAALYAPQPQPYPPRRCGSQWSVACLRTSPHWISRNSN